MKLEKAIELLQGDTFDMEEAFYSELGGDVTAEYMLTVTDAETLINELEIDLSSIDDYNALHDEVEESLYDNMDGGVDGVSRD
ncbi:hypothetical protein HOU90_gp050 [Lactobacillus phage Lpa804]|uniref:Uncharacterized protein n=1 Tax=Lactobacillus phage Lpa804 TaxID=2059850 RepID=A0A3S6QAB5_9CAUD|nr:hypothetical protein HOU90_gp050 [Lactobacillus phage Lpa804]AUG84676.1 hypothetical protein Lpa804_89 [Lactobacillus phage Lpa804]